MQVDYKGGQPLPGILYKGLLAPTDIGQPLTGILYKGLLARTGIDLHQVLDKGGGCPSSKKSNCHMNRNISSKYNSFTHLQVACF
jgi:hypothetical protein